MFVRRSAKVSREEVASIKATASDQTVSSNVMSRVRSADGSRCGRDGRVISGDCKSRAFAGLTERGAAVIRETSARMAVRSG